MFQAKLKKLSTGNGPDKILERLSDLKRLHNGVGKRKNHPMHQDGFNEYFEYQVLYKIFVQLSVG